MKRKQPVDHPLRHKLDRDQWELTDKTVVPSASLSFDDVETLLAKGCYRADDSRQIGRRIVHYRWLLGLSRRDLADFLGIAVWRLVGIEEGWLSDTAMKRKLPGVSFRWLEIGHGPVFHGITPLEARETVLEKITGTKLRWSLGEKVIAEAFAAAFSLPEQTHKEAL